MRAKSKTLNDVTDSKWINGEPGVIRTRDPLLRRQMLCPAELRARKTHFNSIAQHSPEVAG